MEAVFHPFGARLNWSSCMRVFSAIAGSSSSSQPVKSSSSSERTHCPCSSRGGAFEHISFFIACARGLLSFTLPLTGCQKHWICWELTQTDSKDGEKTGLVRCTQYSEFRDKERHEYYSISTTSR